MLFVATFYMIIEYKKDGMREHCDALFSFVLFYICKQNSVSDCLGFFRAPLKLLKL